ncbi:3-deoxy-manno-octulosonate cytidylyltransferase [Sneathiella marina]|uniref:3-deoxy-manno-octulosonate cytidylyltransferase n=1 Tax=Sneathiella marina TaxID=2950108 RepID=A0ABY4W4I6_9PROT|nr:3-deoxy-manno-octulosonate cytidylyltransferase [Sneathiella marina]USG61739.1 3-deoxy-manno-octulosonate cytidylyltransferase [Sneathiella marina]
MTIASNPIIVIPARMASTRLPGKPLADIDGKPMIVQVLRRAEEADIGPAIVACAEPEIVEVVEAAGGQAILTRADHPSGSDRVFEAMEIFDPEGQYDAVVNLQGDLPALDPGAVSAVFQPLSVPDVDISTLVAEITDPTELDDESAVKAVVSFPENSKTGRAIWFSRFKSPWGMGPHYHHIGIYAYRRDALKRFVSLPVAPLEAREKLEQLRALEAGMRIDAALVDTVPLGVDTPGDLARIRQLFTTSSS